VCISYFSFVNTDSLRSDFRHCPVDCWGSYTHIRSPVYTSWDASAMMTWKVARSLHHFFLHLLLCLFRYLSPVEVLIFYILKSLYYVRPPHSSTLQWRLRWVQLNLGPANSYLFVCSLHWLTIGKWIEFVHLAVTSEFTLTYYTSNVGSFKKHTIRGAGPQLIPVATIDSSLWSPSPMSIVTASLAPSISSAATSSS